MGTKSSLAILCALLLVVGGSCLLVFGQEKKEPTMLRTWTDSTGKHKVQAELIEFKDGKVRMKKADGGTLTVPIERLSQEDQEFVKSQMSSEQKEVTVDLGGGVAMVLVLIPAGSFMMGDEKGHNDEKPAHKVNITKPFYLGKYEVTQEQWQAVMGSNPSEFKGPKNPVDSVSWDECQTFFGKLNEKHGSVGVKFGLPTEAQWEYACRAGSTSRWCFGDDDGSLGEYAWCASNSVKTTHPVGERKPNAWGLYDMHGNVWEWCRDWYDPGYYAKSSADDPTGPVGGSYPVVRGGVWDHDAPIHRSAFRHSGEPGRRSSYLGFRVSRVVADK